MYGEVDKDGPTEYENLPLADEGSIGTLWAGDDWAVEDSPVF